MHNKLYNKAKGLLNPFKWLYQEGTGEHGGSPTPIEHPILDQDGSPIIDQYSKFIYDNH